ncbi:MAG: PKD domain-containing protein [Gammaproteobacteria bacterium]|nr:PKD domain-containing protein [Gammaproteobacteria bacterium]
MGTNALQNALLKAGFEVVLSENSEYQYDGSNPSLADFNLVIHLNGTTHGLDMPLSGQQALVDYVRYGGGYIHSAWNAYEYSFGGMQLMRDLVLFDRLTGECYEDKAYVALDSAINHPILANVPASFSFPGGFNVGALHPFSTQPSTLLMSAGSNAAVAVREFGQGRIAAFNHSGNYAECVGDIPHLDSNVQQLYVDAAHWVSGTRAMNSVSLESNRPPVAVADAVAVECSVASSAEVTLQGGHSSDPDGDSLAYFWTWLDGQAVGVSPTAIFSLGVTEVTLMVDDGQGLTASEQTSITVQDSLAPVVSAGLDQILEANSPAGAVFDLASQASATDGCCEVSLVTPLGQYALGQHRLTATALDCADNLGRDSMLLTVVDRTPPLLRAALVRVRFVGDDDEDEGENHEDEHDEDEKDDEKQRFRVQFNASDLVDLNPVVKAELWVVGYEKPIMVSNGQLIEFEYEDDESEVEFEEGLLEVEAAGMMLRVSAVDASGNRAVIDSWLELEEERD